MSSVGHTPPLKDHNSITTVWLQVHNYIASWYILNQKTFAKYVPVVQGYNLDVHTYIHVVAFKTCFVCKIGQLIPV